MHYTDTQLKQALAKMLPEIIYFGTVTQDLEWHNTELAWEAVRPTELLHLCWLVEEGFTEDTDLAERYNIALRLIVGNALTLDYSEFYILHATWQQRVIALANVKGIEIV